MIHTAGRTGLLVVQEDVWLPKLFMRDPDDRYVAEIRRIPRETIVFPHLEEERPTGQLLWLVRLRTLLQVV